MGKRMKGIIRSGWQHCLPGRGRLEGEPRWVSTVQTGTRSAGRRGEQQVQVPGHSEERVPQRLWPPQYLDVSHKVININFHLPRIFRGPLDNHLFVLPGVIATRRLYLPNNFADDLEKRGRGERAGEAFRTELEKSGFPGMKLGERQPLSSSGKNRDGSLTPSTVWKHSSWTASEGIEFAEGS